MPHAVIRNASHAPQLANTILAREGGRIHKVIETWSRPGGSIYQSLVTGRGEPVKLLVRVDDRDEDLVIHLEDHLRVERTSEVFDHLALVARRVIEANPGSSLGETNLAERIERLAASGEAPA